MAYADIINIKRQAPEAVLDSLLKEGSSSKEDALKLVRLAASYGLGLRDYLTIAIDPRLSATPEKYAIGNDRLMSGYEATLAHLRLPLRNDYRNGISTQLASNTFQTYEGTRIMFPLVLDDMVQNAQRVGYVETTQALVGQSRTINGVELLTTVIKDDTNRDNFRTSTIAEGARVPVRRIQTTEHSVKFYKFGSAYEFTYEFNRRASLDLFTPYAARVLRELEADKVAAATYMLINGDAVQPAATVVKQSDFGGTQSGMIEYKSLLKWLVNRAKNGTPVDTVVGNYDSYIEWLSLFMAPAVQTTGANKALDTMTPAERLSTVGASLGTLPILNTNVTFALSSAAPDGQLIGLRKGETLEELIEAGSSISESETAITTQVVTYVKTENAGYRLVFGDTRQIYDYKN